MKTLMLMKTTIVVVLMLNLVSCASKKTFGDGAYEQADYSEQPTHWEDRFNEWDSRELIKGSLESFGVCGLRKNHVYMIANFENQTSEELDMAQLKREMIDQIQLRGLAVVDKESRPDIHQEHEYNATGYVNPAKAAVKGKQEGVEILLRVAVSSKTQVSPDKNEKTVRYKLSVQGVDMESALVKCTGLAEVKKRYQRVREAF